MNPTDTFIARENIEHFLDRLCVASGNIEHRTLAQLLIEEETRFARRAERLDLLDYCIARCDGFIAKQKGVLEGTNASPGLSDPIHQKIGNLSEARALFLEKKEILKREMTAQA